MTETFDVVVAGAGPVGLMLACELRLAGVRVLVVERLTEPDRTIKAGAINVPTAQAFYRRGLLPQLVERHRAAMAGFAGAVRPHLAPRGRGPVPVGHFAGIFLDLADIDLTDPVFAELGPLEEATVIPQQGIEEILTARAAELGVRIRRGAELTGGQGLNLGIGDAVNLGWKLAAVVAGRADAELLDTYTAERHPIGAWVLEWTRAQVAIMRLDAHSRAMRAVTAELLATRDGATTVFKRISGVLHRYDLGPGHPLVGASAPDVALADGTCLGEHGHDGRAVLLDLTDSPTLRAVAEPWADRVCVVTAKSAEPRALSSMLVRPDGIVAWAADEGIDGLGDAMARWFGGL